ncbi:MerR family transcriptional regulator [Streptomyces sp. NPDC047108]|uniref:MerR family transcriptional regulator n=1 Tax=Streptomyces sp. NPDC047108 TaxID=3155025 RepID=UPI0033DB9C1B
MSALRISQLAEITGVPATTLRFYESAGLLPADRTPAGYRTYGGEAVERLAVIGAAKRLGLPLGEIGDLLDVWEAGACADVKADLLPRLAARLEGAERQRADVTSFIAVLRSALGQLETLPDRAGRCDSGCSLARSTAAERDMAAEAEPWRFAPVACSLSAGGLEQRVCQWHTAVDGAVRARIPDGVRLTLPVERAGTVAALAAAEQRCCPFLDFHLHLDGEALHLEVRAPADGVAMLDELFGPTA